MPLRIVQSIETFHRWRHWRDACALGIGFSYVLTYLLVSWCLATGAFHAATDTPHTSHHHEDAHAQHHHHDTPSSERSWVDICDVALQVLLASAWFPSPETVAVWAPGDVIRRVHADVNPSQIPANLSIRSPPWSMAM